MNEKAQENEEINTTKETNLKEDVSTHVDISIRQTKKLMQSYLNNPSTIEKADKLAYWLEDYYRFLSFEDTFNPSFLKSYTRGDIVKVNLGYNIGNEEGGLHYCVVVDKHNAKSSGVITVIPLTSYKGKKIHYTSVFLGDEIYQKLKEKSDNLIMQLSHKILSINPQHLSQEELNSALEDLRFAKKVDDEMSKMKKGSVALVSQIVTVSKQKIYDPQKKKDVLSDLRLSDSSLDLINDKMKDLFIK